MGTDIQMFVERQFGDKWKRVSDKRGIISPHYSDDLSDSLKQLLSEKRWHPGIHYALFGMLAGVRSKQYDAIVTPRGLPEKLSMGVRLQYKENENIIHTASYFTLEELLAWRDKSSTVTYFLNAIQYKKYVEAGKIVDDEDHKSYHINCPRSSNLVSNAKMSRIMEMLSMFDENEYMTRVDQEIPFTKISKAFWVDIVNEMLTIDSDPTKVRCIFWFED